VAVWAREGEERRRASGCARLAFVTREDGRLAAERLDIALDLAELAEEMVECRIRREHPEASDEDVERALGAWYATRSGALHGDGDGRPVPWPRR